MIEIIDLDAAVECCGAIRVGDTTFSDITSAVAAATTGQTIVIPPGTYPEGDLFSGSTTSTFNMEFALGATVNAPVNAKAIFDTTSLPGVADIKITGRGIFNKASDASFKGIIYQDNTSDNIYIEMLSANGNGNTVAWLDGGFLHIKAEEKLESAGGDVLFTGSDVSTIVCEADILEDLGFIVVDANGAFGTIIVKTRKITSGASAAINCNAGSTVRVIDFDFIETGDNSAITGDDGTGEVYLQGRRMENSSTNSTINTISGIVDVSKIENFNGSIYDAFTASSISMEFINCNVIGNISAAIIRLGATVTFKLKNCRVENKNGGATAHVIEKFEATLIIEGGTLITAGTGDSIFASTAQNVKVYSGVANKEVNSNISQQVANLLIDSNVE